MKFHETLIGQELLHCPGRISTLDYPPKRRLPNLGKILGMANNLIQAEADMHADVRAWGAPSECHRDVARGAHADYLELGDYLESKLGFTPTEILHEAIQRFGGKLSYRATQWVAGIERCAAARYCREEEQRNERAVTRVRRSIARRLP